MSYYDSLAKVIKSIMLEQPFYGLFLLNVNKEFNDRCPTAGVSRDGINFRLQINPTFWDSLSEDHKEGLIIHEALHIIYDHLNLREGFTDFKLFNIAADCELNQYIEPKKLPDGAITPDTFKDKVQLDERAGTHYYYAELEKLREQNPDMFGDNGMSTMDDHDQWDTGEELTEAHKKLARKQVEHLVQQAAEQALKARGILPGNIHEIYRRITKPEEAKFNWKAYLRQFAGGSVRSEIKSSRKKINRRLEKEQVPGKKFLRRKHILVGIDTSGSVSDEELKEFMNEIHHIYKAGAEITIAQCDTDIKSVEKYQPTKDIEIKGRGGTEFDPIIELFNKGISTYTCLIYLTDGEASCTVKPRGRVLWTLSSRSSMNESLPGSVIKLN